MESDSHVGLISLGVSNEGQGWNKTFNALFTALRKNFIFDNLAIYIKSNSSALVEAVYARAVGRGRSKEADASWGQEIANRVISSAKVTVSVPQNNTDSDRVAMPYMLGLPLDIPDGAGALVFIRFGGPEFLPEQYPWALLTASQVTRVIERQKLVDALDQLEKAYKQTRLQDDIIATISHELHTPLGFIKGYATSLLRSDIQWDNSTQKEFLTIIDEETDHLIRLIDKMLDSARLKSGTMTSDFQPVRLDALIRDIVLRIQERYKDLEINLDLQQVPPIMADAVQLSQVLINLFENTVKHAHGSNIEIRLIAEEMHLVFLFTDHGPGIPEEHLPYLFSRFYRVPDGNHKRGTGLGLFICSQIIQAHHGQIEVKSVPGKGTTFRIDLPYQQPAVPVAR